MLKFQGALKGKRLNYPFEIEKIDGLTKTKVVIENDKCLMDIIEESLNDPFNKKKKITQVMEELGFNDTLTLLDERSHQILDCYQFYKFAPHECMDNHVWFESYNIISQIEEAQRPRLF